MGGVSTDVMAETTDVLQRLIRNSCVNEGTPESGHEIRSVDLLERFKRCRRIGYGAHVNCHNTPQGALSYIPTILPS